MITSANKWLLVYILGLLMFFISVNSQSTNGLICESIQSCGACLQNLGCVWCLHPLQKNTALASDNNTSLSHCITKEEADKVCSLDNLIDKNTKGRILQDRPLQSKTGTIVQIKPQKISIDLRIGQSYDIQFKYSQAENYPVDLYYIIDNSFSMRAHKEKLAKLGIELAKKMQEITNDVRIGFGSFIDKKTLPFQSTTEKKLKNPCSGSYKCIPPYSFRNHMPLSTNFEKFKEEVEGTKSSASLDHPEGGFDAIMQAIVCQNEIGWRPHARHLIIFSTDAQFHIAGDGKLGGIVETNDAKCHLINNEYDGLHNDYPSVSQLKYIAAQNNINIIFAITNTSFVIDSYELLSDEIKQNSKVGVLSKNSDNVIGLVVDNYQKILNSITFHANATKNIQVQIKPNCDFPIQDGCDQIKLGQVVNITATFNLLKCEDESQEPIRILLKPDALNESLTVEIHPICKCDCESSYEENSTQCGEQGNLVCGICSCHKDRRGSKCECNSTNANSLTPDSKKNCRKYITDEQECSGKGSCLCGTCSCNTNSDTGNRYWGKYCECDNDSCEREKGELCGNNGNCSCGMCICNAGWTGSSCKCPDNNRNCIRNGGMETCSGNGNCNCGECKCNDHFSGLYCEVCRTCYKECDTIQNCVECKIFGTGNLKKEQCDLKCNVYDIKAVDKFSADDGDDKEKLCPTNNNKCEIKYKYKYDESKKLIFTVLKDNNCEPNLLAWVLGVIGSIILLGILTLLIWKAVTSFHDRREYQKFYNEQKQSKWNRNDNPLYKHATTTFENPYYPH